MAVDKFKFISPGIFIDEIDESALPSLPERMGPLIIGRFAKGPGKRPVQVNSFKEFVQIFGAPSAGTPAGDVWRRGELTAPTYAAYAAQAWLRNNSPCTVYRVMGEHPTTADTSVATAQAGWVTDSTLSTDMSDVGGAYGLFVMPSASWGPSGVAAGDAGIGAAEVTGTLAAIWYVQDGGIVLSGTTFAGTGQQGSNLLIKSTNQKFTAKVVSNGTGTKNAQYTVEKAATFNFDKDSDIFIRKVFNTDPTKTNSAIASTVEKYWLGETFETNVRNNLYKNDSPSAVATTGEFFGVIFPLNGESNEWDLDWADRRQSTSAAKTGWFFSQDTRGGSSSAEAAGFDATQHTQKLFRFHALDSGEHANRDYKISLRDIKNPSDQFNKYGTFTVLVRAASDNDSNPIILEQFSSVTLNPNSTNFIQKVIGDRNFTFNSTNKTLLEHGNYPNRSKYIYVQLDPAIEVGDVGEGKLPFGVYGPVVPRTFQLLSGSSATNLTDDHGGAIDSYIAPSGSLPPELIGGGSSAGSIQHPAGSVISLGVAQIVGSSDHFTASLRWPTTRLRVSASEGNPIISTNAYWGYQSVLKDTRVFDQSNYDLLRGNPSGLEDAADTAAKTQYSWIFTLDDLRLTQSDSSKAFYASGSRGNQLSLTAQSGSAHLLDQKWNRFTSPMYGGFDGYDVTEKDPFRNEYLSSNAAENTNYAWYSIKKAIDMVSDTEFVEFDVATVPGVTNSKINTMMVNMCEDRADAMAIIDVDGGYKPPHENTDDEPTRIGSVDTTVTNLKDLGLNSSYGATFYPFVKILDNINDAVLFVPPSVVALGTFSSSQRKSAVWFAPAGFTRGGLSEGSAGLPVIGVRQRLTSADRDKLYDANINPIASFPAEGIVIFGQKTLQVTPSALDRINVRRLLIFLKKEISRISSRILFEQNVVATWDRFTGQVVPFLAGVKAGLGLTDFKVILDSSTTTPDLVDRNILYAKIFLKPARAIEFIALDFIITRSGASFDD